MNRIMETLVKSFEPYLDKARMGLILHDGFQAMFFTSKDGKTFEELLLSMQPDMKQIESLQMKTICSDPVIKYAALLLDCNTVVVDTADVPNVGNVKDHPYSMEAVLLIMYAREGLVSSVRTLPYKKKGDQEYWFGDMGWRDVPSSEGLFENVFK